MTPPANVGDVPFAGDALRAPFDEGSGAGRDLAEAAQSYQDAVADLALLAGVLIALAPIAIVLALWLPRRVSWIATASAAKRLLRGAATTARTCSRCAGWPASRWSASPRPAARPT